MPEPRQHIYTDKEICNIRHKWLNWFATAMLSGVGLLLTCTGWSMYSGMQAIRQSQDAINEVRIYTEKWEERSEKYNERNAAIQKTLEDIKRNQDRIRERIETWPRSEG